MVICCNIFFVLIYIFGHIQNQLFFVGNLSVSKVVSVEVLKRQLAYEMNMEETDSVSEPPTLDTHSLEDMMESVENSAASTIGILTGLLDFLNLNSDERI